MVKCKEGLNYGITDQFKFKRIKIKPDPEMVRGFELECQSGANDGCAALAASTEIKQGFLTEIAADTVMEKALWSTSRHQAEPIIDATGNNIPALISYRPQY